MNIKYILVALFIVGFGLLLRTYKLSSFPPSLYWEEVALGYDAYALLETGADHHGTKWPIAAFESYGDWKPSGYFYALIPSIALFGLNEFAVRLPSAIAGTILIFMSGLLFSQLLTKTKVVPNKVAENWKFLVMLVVAASPWAIQFSRAAWEVNLATALLVSAVVLFIFASKSHHGAKTYLYMLFSAILFAGSAYTYHATRIVAVLLAGVLVLIQTAPKSLTLELKNVTKWMAQILQHKWKLGLFIFTILICILPIVFSVLRPEQSIRLQQTSIFTDLGPLEKSNALIEGAGTSPVARVMYHRFVLYGREIVRNFLSHFTLEFLFLTGDDFPRHSLQVQGLLYLIELPLLLLGVYFSCKHWNRWFAFVYAWLVIGVLPSAVSIGSPHALRALPTMPVFLVLVGFGLYELCSMYEKYAKRIFSDPTLQRSMLVAFWVVMLCSYTTSFAYFWQYYSKVYPRVHQDQWQYGYKQLTDKLGEYEAQLPDHDVYISREWGRPAMYYWFFTQQDPREVQDADETSKQDQGEFLEFKNKHFVAEPFMIPKGRPVLAASGQDFFERFNADRNNQAQVLETIYGLNGEIQWVLYKL